MHEEMLTYGLKKETGELLHIDRIDVANGLKCGCVCPNCKYPLVARNEGKKKAHHFAHYKGAECGKGRMTALHMLAQKVLERDKTVMLPDYHSHNTQSAEFDEVKLEVTSQLNEEKRLRPDCIGFKYINGNAHQLWIEIRVTHEVDEKKRQYIKASKIACIEINLSDLLDIDYSDETITKRLRESKYDREWICCPKWEEECKEKRKEIHSKYETQEHVYSHFILYPNGEATLTPLNGNPHDAFEKIAPTNESIFEVIVSAPSDFYTYHFCYHEAVKAVYKRKDCRTCKKRKYNQFLFQNRDLQLLCDYSRDLPSRFLTPQMAVTCSKYEFDTQINNYKADILRRIK